MNGTDGRTANGTAGQRKRISGQQYFNENERQDLRIVFMGTPEFADAVAARTGARLTSSSGSPPPDKPAGRGQKLRTKAT